MDNTELRFDNAALDEMASIAYHLGTGARALRNIAETVMTDIMFDAPNNKKKRQKAKITISKETVIQKTQKKYRIAC
jgi:ATP-dependent Clp protease ATP-binding subunit ClpX